MGWTEPSFIYNPSVHPTGIRERTDTRLYRETNVQKITFKKVHFDREQRLLELK